jgi:hypothetical protein
VALVDGVMNGSQGLGLTDGVDHLSRAAGQAAFHIGTAYEANKLANNGDAYYGFYDGLVLSAHAYRVAANGTTIEFDPNAPGYAFIPQQAMAELAFAQDDAATAMYLVTGLMDCFATSSGQNFWDFKTQVMGSGTSAPGGWPQNGTLSQYDGSTDTFSAAPPVPVGGKGNANQVTYTMTPKTYGSQYDQWFGILTSNNANFFPAWASDYQSNALPKISKFTGGNGYACSPFNGPGGGNSNQYFVTKLNGQTIGTHFQGVGSQCQNQGQCSSTLTTDPALYTLSAAAYDVNNNMIGPIANPFQFDPNYVYADPGHQAQWALQSDNVTLGCFDITYTHFGVTKYKYDQNCAH